MAVMQMAIKIQIRRGLASEWTSANPILALGEQGLETDTRKVKFGDGITAWNSLPYSVDKSQIGLGNVDNTSDVNKPISSATQSALNLKADASSVYTKTESDSNFEPKNTNIQSHISNLSNPHEVTKTQVGLSNVPNIDATSRANHTGTQLASTISDFTSAVQAITIDASKIDGGNVSNLEFSYLDGVTSSIQTQLNGKEPTITAGTSSQYYRGDKTFQTLDKAAVGLPNVDDVSAANLRDRSTHTGNETTLTFSEGSAPSAPASGLTTYSQGIGGRQMFGQLGKSGVSYAYQPFLARNRITLHQANGNATTITSWGAVAPTASGTATARNVATTNFFTWTRRVGYVSATTNNSSAGIRSAVAQYGIGNTARAGGFHFVARLGISDAVLVPGARLFAGLTSSTAVLGNQDPSNFLNIIGIGMDAADTTLQFMYNDGVGAATKVDLGASFPETTNTDMFEVSIYCAPNATTIYYDVTNLTTNIEVSGVITTNIPLNTQLLAWQIWRHNVATGLAVGVDVVSVYIETDN